MGSDPDRQPVLERLVISIHAPAWGATGYQEEGCEWYELFQSTLPHGERRSGLFGFAVFSEFQSTLPHGERPAHDITAADSDVISIHAPAWGATCWPMTLTNWL